MTLQPPVLDDLTWDALMEATRRRIPAESRGRWTLHAPSDPGVTVLELFAYLLEQRLYWLDQAPDALVLAVLRLLGVDPPQPAVPAATVLRFTPVIGASLKSLGVLEGRIDHGIVPAGTVVSRDPAEFVTFTLDQDVAVVPLRDEVRLIAGGQDRSADLAARRGVPVLSAGGGATEFRIELRPAGPASPGTVLSVLFELAAPAQCPPSWSPGAVDDVAPPATLSWQWYAGESTIDASDVDDGTAGLRRSGIVRLPLPDEWSTSPPEAYGLRVHTADATYSAPPVLLQIAPNAGAASNRETRTVTDADLADQLATWLRLPGQHLTLPDARGVLLGASLRLRRDGELREWTAATDFTFAGPADRVFLVDRVEGALRFGDGLTGAIPVLDDDTGGEPVAVVEFARGGGAAGNGGQTGNWVVAGRPELAAANVVPAAGGRDAETVAQARRRAAEELGRVTRAVTAADFAELAATTPGVAVGRSYVGIGEHPSYPCVEVPGAVTVRVVPLVERGTAQFEAPDYSGAVQPDPGLLAEVREHLEQARLVGTELFVCRPRYRHATLRVDLAGRPAEPADVRAALRLALRRYLDPLVGGDDGTGWPFGGPLRPSALLRVAQEAVADEAEPVAVAIGLDGAPPAEDCTDVPLRPGELVTLDHLQIRATEAQP